MNLDPDDDLIRLLDAGHLNHLLDSAEFAELAAIAERAPIEFAALLDPAAVWPAWADALADPMTVDPEPGTP